MRHISVVIPALNEEEPIVGVVREIATTTVPDEIIVVDNGSTDRTAERASEAGEASQEQPEYLRVFMGQLRKKLEPDPSNPRYLVTEPWVGYKFNPQG